MDFLTILNSTSNAYTNGSTNDEVFENRKVAVKLIGRLALHNPAYVMPSLRKALIQLMTELQFATAMYVNFWSLLFIFHTDDLC